MKRLTGIAHDLVKEVLTEGDVAVDATAGNGHDTLFLARCVGPTGTVYAFDIQEAAIQQTNARIHEADCHNVLIHRCSHASLNEKITSEHIDKIGAVMFNLGYLPGGDKECVTRIETTLPAIRASLELLRPGGVLTVIAYTGHPGGLEEADAVEGLLTTFSGDEFTVKRFESGTSNSLAPRLLTAKRAKLYDEPRRPTGDPIS